MELTADVVQQAEAAKNEANKLFKGGPNSRLGMLVLICAYACSCALLPCCVHRVSKP